MTNHFRLLLVCASLASLLAAGQARAQSGFNTLEGRVSLPGGSPPPTPVRVTLTFNGRRVYETFTDLSGRFSFNALANGRYQLAAEGDELTFVTTSVYAEVTAFGASPQTFTQNIQLQPKPAPASLPAGVVSAEEFFKDVPPGAREKYQKGLKSATEEKPEQSIKYLLDALSEHPNFYDANLLLAEQYGKLQRYDEALATYRKASEINPERADAYIGIGATLVSQKRFDEGIKLLRRVVELDEKLVAPYLSLGYAEMMIGDYRAAETHLTRAHKLTKTSIAHIYLANVYEKLGEPTKAIERLEAYLKENPATPNSAQIKGAIEKLRKQATAKQ
jgi:tetratricopeptide (TPR) repeat protein